MDKYLVDPLARWIVHSTGWTVSRAKTAVRVTVVVVAVVLSVVAYLYFELP